MEDTILDCRLMSDLAALPDAELISRCLDKDADAWEILIRRYQRLIASITVKFRLSREDAADVFQLVSIALFKQLPAFNREARLSSWFITVTVRECWKLRKRSGRTTTIEDSTWNEIANSADPDAATSEDQVLMIERQQFVRSAIQKLGEQCQLLLRRLFYSTEDLSYAELGAEIGMPVPSIGPVRGRCLTRLKVELQKMGYRWRDCI